MIEFLFIVLSLLPLVPGPASQVEILGEDGVQKQCVLSSISTPSCADAEFGDILSVWGEFMKGGNPAGVRVRKDCALERDEYRLVIDSGGIDLFASAYEGAWLGLETLTQIIVMQGGAGYLPDTPGNGRAGELTIPAVEIRDKPLFRYRGAHLDCCRHFFSVDDVKRYIDIMCLHHLNTFHWHLTDDQGWRFEVKKYPLLTTVGAVRAQTLKGHSHDEPKVFDGTPYGEGCFYSQEQCRDIVEYAARRGISVIPEIDMPGHFVAALACYPSLGCTGGPYKVREEWGISKDVLCLGKEESYRFVEDVLTEVCDVFPSRFIHIGGDEAPVIRRKTCPYCQAMKDSLGLQDEKMLQGHLICRVEAFLRARGREIIGWNEILNTGISKEAVIMSWQGNGGSGIEAARRGHRVIMVPGSYFYFDYYQTADRSREPLAIGGFVPLSKVYSYDYHSGLTDKEASRILGLQCNLWTEYVGDFKHVEQMVLPRMAALAELGWGGKTEYSDFLTRLKTAVLPLYKWLGCNYAPYDLE